MEYKEKGLFFTTEHEWISFEGAVAVVGVSDYAQGNLGDVVYIELPQVGQAVVQAEEVGNIESIKAVSSIYAPLSGEIITINNQLASSPELINTSCYDQGWLFKLKLTDPEQKKTLLDFAAYQQLISE